MKAKACTRCRQAKLRCDPDPETSDTCIRCRSINKLCIFDRTFRATSKSRRLKELEAEVERLREAANDNNIQASPDVVQQTQLHPVSFSTTSCRLDKSIGNVNLTAAQVTECFRVFFLNCHPYLPLSIPNSPETVHETCPFLFWVICAAASSTDTMLLIQSSIQAMIGQIVVSPPRLVEVVQGLLILCMWPFPFHSTLGDPSFVYSGLATQIGLQIGLHKPSLSREFSSKRQVLDVGDDVRKSTWMSCYVVNQMQAGRLGAPLSIQPDHTFLRTLETSKATPSLINMCRISHITAQFTSIIGASAESPSGLVVPITRVAMVKYFSQELKGVQSLHLTDVSQVVEIYYTTSRLQLWSFLLHDDIHRSRDVIEFVHEAEKDATWLIHLASEKNLSRCPFHLARSVLYAAITLIKILNGPYVREHKLIADQIQLGIRTLASAVRIEDDHVSRWSRHLQTLLTLKDQKRTPPIRSRMAASLMYDAIRMLKEDRGLTVEDPPTSFNVEGDAELDWTYPELGYDLWDLDGMDWNDIGGLL